MCNQNRSRITRDRGFVTVSMRNTSSVTVLLLSLLVVASVPVTVSQVFQECPSHHQCQCPPLTQAVKWGHTRGRVPTKGPVMSAPTSAVGGGDKQSRNLIPPKNPSIRCGGGGRERRLIYRLYSSGAPGNGVGPGRMWRDTFGKLLTRP